MACPHGSSNGSHNGADHLVLLATGTGFAGVFPILMAALHDRRIGDAVLGRPHLTTATPRHC